MAKINKMRSRIGFLGFITIFCYCLSAVIGGVWITVGAMYATGVFNEKIVKPADLYFQFDSLSFEDTSKKRDNCLRITGLKLPKEDEETLTQKVEDEEEKDDERKNPTYDRTFCVLSNTKEVSSVDVILRSSDPGIATVPNQVKLGEDVEITPVLDKNGNNKGGFIYITAETADGVYTSDKLFVLVDVPAEEVEIDVPSDMGQYVYDEELYQDVLEDEITPQTGDVIYTLYQGEIAKLDYNVAPIKSLNPTLNSEEQFEKYCLSNKTATFSVVGDSIYAPGLIVDSFTGEIEAISPGIYKVLVKCFVTYDDQIFVEDYKYEYEWDVIPPEKLEGRYVYDSIFVEVKPILLEKIQITDQILDYNLFETYYLTAEQLGIKLVSNKNETEYFQNEIPNLIMTSSDDSVLKVTKVGDEAVWKLETLAENSNDVSLKITHPDYDETVIFAVLDKIRISPVEISSVILNGDYKSQDFITYNDQVDVALYKEVDENGVEKFPNDIYDGEKMVPAEERRWEFVKNSSVVINSKLGEGILPTYTTYRLFATGVYQTRKSDIGDVDEPIDGVFVNEQGNPIINLDEKEIELLDKHTAREIKNCAEIDNFSYIECLNRGRVILVACVIKTDINGNPIDADGYIITSSEQDYVIVAQSEPVVLNVMEKLQVLSATIEKEVVEPSGEETTKLVLNSEKGNANLYKIIVQNNSALDIKLDANSYGALIDYNKVDLLGNKLIKFSLANVDKKYKDSVQVELIDPQLDNSLSSLASVSEQKQNEDDGDCNHTSTLKLNFNLAMGGLEFVDVNLAIEIFTGSATTEDGFETLMTIQFRVVVVPVESITLKTNMIPVEIGTQNYVVVGIFDYTKKTQDGNLSSFVVKWGQVQGEQLVEMKLNEPVIKAKQIKFDGESWEGFTPKILTATNAAYSYMSSDTSVLEIDDENDKLIVKKIDEVSLRVISNDNDEIYDTISIKFVYGNNYEFTWNGFNDLKYNEQEDQFEISKQQLKNGILLDVDTNFVKITNGNDKIWAYANDYKDDGTPVVKYKITSQSVDDIAKITIKTIDEPIYDGRVLTTDLAKEGYFILTAYIQSENGFIISKDYKFVVKNSV